MLRWHLFSVCRLDEQNRSGTHQTEIRELIQAKRDRWSLDIRVAHIRLTRLNSCKIVKIR